MTLFLAMLSPAAGDMCLPSLAEQGRRLHEMPAPSMYWLELLLRQHEACWSAGGPHAELRVFFYGNSSVMGDPHGAADTVPEHLNRLWESAHLPAHAFNFGFAANDTVKDMLIVRESLRYRPDVIVYGTSPLDFSRLTATDYVRGASRSYLGLVRLMRTSAPSILAFSSERPAGIGKALERYSRELGPVERSWWRPLTWPMRDVLAFAYAVPAERLRLFGEWLGLVTASEGPVSGPPAPLYGYSCRDTHREDARSLGEWNSTNSLAYLARLRDRTGVPVVIVHWPLASGPLEDCYNQYLTNQTMRRYTGWLNWHTRRLGLPLVDLSRVLFPWDFLDAVHPNARGQRKIAGALSPQLTSILRQRIAEVLPAAQPH